MEFIRWAFILGISAVITSFFGTLVYVIILAVVESYQNHTRQREILNLRHQIMKHNLQTQEK